MEVNDNNSFFEEPEERFTNDEDPALNSPERHGCVTTWLVIMLILNAIISLAYLLMASGVMRKSLLLSPTTLIILALAGALNVVLSIMLLSWRKIAFYGFAIMAICTFVFNISIGISIVGSLLGLSGIVILYGVFQIKKNGVAAWDYLK